MSSNNNENQMKSKDTGFSLIELIVVVVIIGILILIAIPIFLNVQDNARQSAVEAEAASALTPVQEEVLDGLTQSGFDDVIERLSTNDNVELSIVDDNFRVGDPDSVCVQASWIGADNVAVAGACAGSSGGDSEVGDDEEDHTESSGDMELVWNVTENRDLVGHDSSITGLNVVIPIQGNVSGTINWGDGNETEITGDNPSHSYEEEGEYSIMLQDASFDSWSAADLTAEVFFSDLSGLTRVDEWGDTGTVSLEGGFVYAYDLEYMVTPPASVRNMSYMLPFTLSLNEGLDEWDVSNVEDMSFMFMLTGPSQDISGWDVSNVTNMSHMFYDTYEFNQDLNEWDTSSVEDMSSMFRSASHFNGDISGWNVSNVTNMSEMFMDAYNFNQDIGGWNTEKVTDMSDMFRIIGRLGEGSQSQSISPILTKTSVAGM